ncbi:Cadherin domain and Cadherin-like domain-containing protein [Strongyloides ratti]|uniref:Cadherin domain and Cadherin-like domain-containing protein n=1 Tax=Strongyloides ratti TaxID=34506 RepID=A0A090KQV7_STRRB|nr:Cadherin domain and Cadherin-like domain-containing protein [Strongyloides ratti]CEF59918.1 Cadherin domain and Cadherin-like domain-containing protein [Strongyloides ratti]
MYNVNVSNNNDEIEDISGVMNIENDIITFEPDIFMEEIGISQIILKNDIITESKVNSFNQNKITFECFPIKMITCKTEKNKDNDGDTLKIIANKDFKKNENITYINVKIFLHYLNGTVKEYRKGKNVIKIIHHIFNDTIINDEEKNKDSIFLEDKILDNVIKFDQSKYYVMLFSGPTKKSVVSRGKITLQNDKKTMPKIWIENQSNEDIFDIENIKYVQDGLYNFDIITKNNLTIKESYDKNTTITGIIKAKQSNMIGEAEIIGEIIFQSTFIKNKSKHNDNTTLPTIEKKYTSIEILKEINSKEHMDDILIPFKNLNINDKEISRKSIDRKDNSYFKDNDEVVLNKVLQFNYTNVDKRNKIENVTNKSGDNISLGKKFVLFNNINSSHVNYERNNYKENVVNGEKIYKVEKKISNKNDFNLQNNNNNNLFMLQNIEEIKNSTLEFAYNLSVLENSINGTIIISKLMILNNIKNEDISVVMFNETKDYLFKIIDNKLILICQNKQQNCIDYEEDKEILLLLFVKQNNPILLNIKVINEDEKDPKIVLYNKDIKISNDKMLNQFLFSITDEDGMESNEILLKGDISKHFAIQKAQDDGLYQIIFLSIPPSGRSELSIIVRGKYPSKRSIIKNVPVKVIDNTHKAHFRKDTYNIEISAKNIIKDEKIIHLELEGVSIDSVDFYVLKGNVGWAIVERYGGDVKIISNNNTFYNGNYDIVIGAIDKESNKIVATTTLTIKVTDGLDVKPTFLKKYYSLFIGSNQKNDTVDINLLPDNLNTKIIIDEDSIIGWNEEVKQININKNYIFIHDNKAKVSLKYISSLKSLYFKVYLKDFPLEKALVGIHVYVNESERQNEIKKYSQLRISNVKLSDALFLNVELPENTTVGKVIENIYSFNPLTGKGPDECFIENGYDKYFHVDTTNGDILLIQQIDYDTLENPQLEVPILCSQNESVSLHIILNVKVINIPDNSPIIKILNAKYPLVYEIDKSTSENNNIFNFSIIDIDGELDHSLEIIGDDSFKFTIEKNFDDTYSLNTVSNAIFDYDDSKTLKLILIAKDNENNVGKEAFTIKFTSNNNQLPYIEKKNYHFKVVQNWPKDVYVGTLYINKNSNYLNRTNINFYIEDQPDDYFKIDKNDGKIYTGKSLKNISIDMPYEMRIIVLSKLNKNFKDSASVTINTIDPDTIILDDKKYLQITSPKDGEVIKVSETLGIQKEIYSVEILYKGNTLDLTNIKYDIFNVNNKSDMTFLINNNGKIILNYELNYEKISKYSLIIEVKNNENNEEMDRILVFIELENENNNLPYFVEDYTNKLFTFNKSSIILGKVQAIDKDFEPFNKIYYHIIKHCGKNSNKLQLDMLTGEIRRTKYKIKNNKQSKILPKNFELCIFASQYNFTIKNSLITFDKNRKDQIKVRIKLVEDDEKNKIENVISNNYLFNDTIEYISTKFDKLPINYNEDKLNYHLHKHQHFSIQSFSLTPANYEPNAKILHINKNKRIFRINEMSGDIIVDPKIITYPEGIYKVLFTLSDDMNLNKTTLFRKNIHFIDIKNKMKFVFDTSASKIGFRLEDFNEALQNILMELSKLNKYKTKIYLENRIRNEKNYKSSVCFHIADEDIVKNLNEYKMFFETLFSKFSNLENIYNEYSVRNIIKCSENWEPHLKKGFIDKLTYGKNNNKKLWRDYIFIIIILIVILIFTAIFLYYCIAMKYRFHLLIKKEHFRLITNKRIMAISNGHEKQYVKNSPQFAIGMNSDLFEY